MGWWILLAVAMAAGHAAEAQEIRVPSGFRIEQFAARMGGPRGLAVDPAGVLFASVPARGRVIALPGRAGSVREGIAVTVLEGLDRPHGLAFRQGHLYVAETGRIVRYRYDASSLTAVEPIVVVDGLPRGGHHWSRSIAFGKDDKLYVAIGSSCDTCPERDPRRAAIVRYAADGSGEERFAAGLRNPVGLAFHPSTGALWTAVNERDWPGGGAPPDYVTDVPPGADFGWPRCYAHQRAFFADPTRATPVSCDGLAHPAVELPPHSAPLGLAFYTGAQFPPQYQGSLFVALHGSRAGLPAAGYAIARIPFRNGRPAALDVFSTGWRRNDQIAGRPVDIAIGRDGSMFVSDDHADRVYQVWYTRR